MSVPNPKTPQVQRNHAEENLSASVVRRRSAEVHLRKVPERGDSWRANPAREFSSRKDWRRERNPAPTFSGFGRNEHFGCADKLSDRLYLNFRAAALFSRRRCQARAGRPPPPRTTTKVDRPLTSLQVCVRLGGDRRGLLLRSPQPSLSTVKLRRQSPRVQRFCALRRRAAPSPPKSFLAAISARNPGLSSGGDRQRLFPLSPCCLQILNAAVKLIKSQFLCAKTLPMRACLRYAPSSRHSRIAVSQTSDGCAYSAASPKVSSNTAGRMTGFPAAIASIVARPNSSMYSSCG